MLLKNVLWDYAGKFASQGVTFGLSILLARLLEPEAFGRIGIIMAILGVSQIFIDLGFGAAIIQKDKVSNRQLSTLFFINVAIGTLLTFILSTLAGITAGFFDDPLLERPIQVISMTFLIVSLAVIPSAQLSKKMGFKKLTIIRTVSVILSGIVGVILAYHGYGLWSLVYQNMILVLIRTLLLWITSSWKPALIFDIKSIQPLLEFSTFKFLDKITSTLFAKLDIFLIGLIFSPATLGFYTRARSFDQFIINYSSASISRVFFPYISLLKGNMKLVKEKYLMALDIVAFISVALSCYLFLVAEDLIILLIGEKWMPSVPLFKLMVLVGFAYPSSAIMVNLIVGLGQAKTNFFLGLIKYLILSSSILFAIKYGILGLLWSLIFINLIGLIINMAFVKKLIFLTVRRQLIVVYKNVLLGSSVTGLISILYQPINIKLVDFTLIFVLLMTPYILLAYIFRFESTKLILSKLKDLRKR